MAEVLAELFLNRLEDQLWRTHSYIIIGGLVMSGARVPGNGAGTLPESQNSALLNVDP